MDPVTWTKLFSKISALHGDVRWLIKALRARDSAASLTIEDFCKREQISKPQFYVLQNEGRGPDLMWLSPQTPRISPEAHARWRIAREREAAADAVSAPAE
jgi:hypothetical protein